MNKTNSIEILTNLFYQHCHSIPKSIVKLQGSGSNRIYYRLTTDSLSMIGAYNEDIAENEAFFSFTASFNQLDIKVPKLIGVAPDNQHYLLIDLGNETLFDRINNDNEESEDSSALCLIKKSLKHLIPMQIKGGSNIDFSKAYPRERFDRQSIMWDLNYFKYEFLKLTNTPFDEQLLEDDFNKLADFLLQTPSNFFMFRDFQSRNIMIVDNEPWFIDYQGGRLGPLQYDVASLLFSPKTKLSQTKREVLLDFYLNHLEEQISVDRPSFIQQYYGFVLIRILQALGAYGYRGIYEKKNNFRKSIPDAIKNLDYLWNNKLIEIELPELKKIITWLNDSKWAINYNIDSDKLIIRVSSFSYKKGIPDDPSDNGGGFVFDCRGLPNPGRYPEYQSNSGLDENVITYLKEYQSVEDFQTYVRNIVDLSINEYLKRGFKHLCVNFGCTGGQHRSVYHATQFANWAKNNYPVEVFLIHNEMDNWKKHE